MRAELAFSFREWSYGCGCCGGPHRRPKHRTSWPARCARPWWPPAPRVGRPSAHRHALSRPLHVVVRHAAEYVQIFGACTAPRGRPYGSHEGECGATDLHALALAPVPVPVAVAVAVAPAAAGADRLPRAFLLAGGASGCNRTGRVRRGFTAERSLRGRRGAMLRSFLAAFSKLCRAEAPVNAKLWRTLSKTMTPMVLSSSRSRSCRRPRALAERIPCRSSWRCLRGALAVARGESVIECQYSSERARYDRMCL
jgi:hypothetical protein